jgi:6-phosphofructokinase 2
VPDDFYGEVAEAVGQRGTRVIVDACGRPLQQALEAHPFMIKPNLRELGDLAGKEMKSDEEIEAAAGKLVDEGNCDICTVSLGAGGALLVSKNGIQRMPSPTGPIRRKVGAGDCSVAGIVTALSRGHSEKEALAMGVAAGAAAVMTPGTELCRRRDVDRLFQALQKKEKESTS